MLPSVIDILGLFFLTILGCFVLPEANSIFNPPAWEQSVTFPPAWVEKCGDHEGDIPLFREKSNEFKACFEKQVNISTFVEEAMEAFLENKIPGFTKKHCAKVPAIVNCMDNFVESVQHCFEPGRQEDLRTTASAIKAALDFVCYRDGERVLIFLREEGIECYDQENTELYKCINESSPEDFTNFTAPGELGFIASLSYDDKLCSHARKVSDCLYTAMTRCSKRQPSLIMEALTKTILKKTPCWAPSGASSYSISSYLLLPILMILGYFNKYLTM